MPYSAKKIRLSCDEKTVHDWANFTRSRPEEVFQSLTKERVFHELWYLGKDMKGLYLIGVMDVNPEDSFHAGEVTKKSKLPINKIHLNFKKYWQLREDVQIDPSKPPEFDHCKLLLDLRP